MISMYEGDIEWESRLTPRLEACIPLDLDMGPNVYHFFEDWTLGAIRSGPRSIFGSFPSLSLTGGGMLPLRHRVFGSKST